MDLFSDDSRGICGESVSGIPFHDGAHIVRMHLPSLCEDIDQTADTKVMRLDAKAPRRDKWVQVRGDRGGDFVDTLSSPAAFLGNRPGMPGSGYREAILAFELRCEQADVMHQHGEIQRLPIEVGAARTVFVRNGRKVIATVTVCNEFWAR